MKQNTTPSTKSFGIVGYPLSHSLSPLIHNSLYKEKGIDAAYSVFESPELNRKKIEELISAGVEGISVTIPHKETAFSLSDRADSASEIMKASNTLVFRNGSINAHNTDGEGALRSVLESFPDSLETGKTLILGSGGSARGIAYSFAKSNRLRELLICSRNETTGKEIADLIGENSPVRVGYVSPTSIFDFRNEISLVIHTTPLGMKGQAPGPFLETDFFHPGIVLFDIVYNPLVTPLVSAAQESGCRIIPGSEMLLFQAMKQFELFTGTIPDERDILNTRKRLAQALNGR
ncbi:shikimate dehydrogenase [Leptospira gomenensis]|uniref:Shikimate dehydrogenase (NADP(+)) n=1 Tax=Leptospira gomenensis TaxID=2484974 RepID=A0A5F1YCJ4_9LEPT|nr:shikimate dehydrogenase [Leptospira gomenensis]TGK32432.1 shikimate dehydrogenase [Leptospira gomenensis]TGK34671.1 shikimate dehydrogenase [Leptospira gomenensis]TGK51032.1 shikimate dehydrogenase [Leptospira gomenensis]TGK68327.1 shikimate dehydrogenase [Leptospira gomenensis]